MILKTAIGCSDMDENTNINNTSAARMKIGLSVLLVLAAILSCLLCSCGESIAKTKISSVTISQNEKDGAYATLKVEALISDDFRESHKGENIYLFEIPAYMSATSLSSLEGLAPIAEKKLRSGSIAFSVVIDDASDISLVSSYLIAHRGDDGAYIPLTTGVYVSNPEALSIQNDKNDTKKDSGDKLNDTHIKGFDISSVGALYELKKLGADLVLVEADIAKLFAQTAVSNDVSADADEDTYTTETETGAVYFDRDNILKLEETVQTLKASGLRVYLRLALKSHPADVPSCVSCMYYSTSDENASDDSSEDGDSELRRPSGYAVNLSTARSADMLFALFSRLAESGLCEDLIIGDALNDTGKLGTSYAFGVETEMYVKNCEALVRMAYICARRVCADSNVYISLGSSWEDTEDDGGISSRRFISLFDTFAEAGGDFMWNAALRAELCLLENESVPDASLRELASRYVPLTDLSDIIDFLSSSTYKYAATEERSVIIDRAEITSVYDGSEARQDVAAAYALSYINAIDRGVDAIIYSGDVSSNRYLYNTFLYIDSSDSCHEGGVLSFISDRLGTEFSTLYTKYNGSEFQKKYTVGKLFSFNNEKKRNVFSVICDFEDGSAGILSAINPSANAGVCSTETHEPKDTEASEGSSKKTHNLISAYVEIGADVPAELRGIRLSPIEPRSLSGREAMSFVLETDVGSSGGCRLVLVLSQGELRYVAETVVADKTYGSVSFDISEFVADMKRKGDISAELYVLSASDAERQNDAKIYLDEVYTVDEKGLFEGNAAFAVTVVVLILIIAVLFIEIIRQAVRRSRYRRDDRGIGRR